MATSNWKTIFTNDELSARDPDHVLLEVDPANGNAYNIGVDTFLENIASYIIGEIRIFSFSPPNGWLSCNGVAISRSVYSGLFAVIGETFGEGDGSTTFNLPDFQGRSPLGVGTGDGLTTRSLGDKGGEEEHQLLTTEMPAHNHQQTRNLAGSAAIGNLGQSLGDTNAPLTYSFTENSGDDVAHNTMHPFLCINLAIYTGVLS